MKQQETISSFIRIKYTVMMNNNFTKTMLIASVALFLTGTARAEDFRKIISLSGTWKFSIGDDIRWASPSWDDSDWDQLNAPEQWERQGYDDYNGYAWYRKKVRIGELPANRPLYLLNLLMCVLG